MAIDFPLHLVILCSSLPGRTNITGNSPCFDEIQKIMRTSAWIHQK